MATDQIVYVVEAAAYHDSMIVQVCSTLERAEVRAQQWNTVNANRDYIATITEYTLDEDAP